MGEAPQAVERGSNNFASFHGRRNTSLDIQYCTYQLQYVEENRRSKENPWSIRHLGVYHHLDSASNLSLWILLCPTPDGPAQQILGALQRASQDTLQDFCDDPHYFHLMLNARYSSNMRWYLRNLGQQLEEQVMPLSLTPCCGLPVATAPLLTPNFS